MSRTYRHELKFFCAETELQWIEHKIKHVCRKDPHVGEEGVYRIRSLYFDTYDSRCYLENEDGADNRAKYRVRIYDASDAVIKLERKGSLRDRKYKESCNITRKQCEQMIQGKTVENILPQQMVLQEFLLERQMELLKPQVIVEYVRTPYIYPVGNVRITFDRFITSSSSEEFFGERIPGRGILPEHMHLLEVKYDEVLPVAIWELLNSSACLTRTSFSKYALCREYGLR
jgi:hypothetical protein